MGDFKLILHQSVSRAPFLCLALAVSGLAAQAQVVFTPPVNVSSNPGSSTNPQIAVDSSGNINVSWLDNTPGYYAVFFSRSTDGGATFSSPQSVSNDPSGSSAPFMAVDPSGNINLVWVDSASPNNIFFSRSGDGGATFSTPKNISNSPGGARTPYIAVDAGGSIYAAWTAFEGSWKLFFSLSTDGGATFSTPIALASGFADGPQLAVDSAGNINVVWIQDQAPFYVAFSRSSDGGATFAAPKQITGLSEGIPAPQMALDSKGDIYVVWYTVPDGNIHLSYSTDGGATFSNTNITNTNNSPPFSQPSTPQIAIDPGGNINVVWTNSPTVTTQITHIFFSRSSDAGATFSTPQDISNDSGSSGGAQIAVDTSGNIKVVWADNTPGPYHIFFKQSNDGGATFSVPQDLSNDSGNSGAPLIAPQLNGGINVIWMDDSPGNLDIFFTSSISLSALSVDPPSVAGGNSSTGTVTLSGPAPSGGAVVNLSSSDASAASVPSSVTVSGGSTSATFTVTTSSVGTSTPVTISGSYNGTTQSATLTVNPPISFTLTVSKTDLGSGTVTSSPAGINCGGSCSASYISGTTVTLTATPGLLSSFGGWTGCDSVSGNTCIVNMNSARSVTADFTLLGLL